MTAIHLQNLVKTHGATRAVDGVDLTVDTGELVALLGPNGAGKSTTIDMLLGLARPDAGAVSIEERPPREAVAAGAGGRSPARAQAGTPAASARVIRTVDSMLAPDPPRKTPLIGGMSS